MAESDLFALLEIMLRTFAHVPKVKPGGYSEEMFLDITEDEREELECNICYQVLKDVRQCENKHMFCYSCIFVWSTSGSPVNHSRCPVCRVQGIYVRNQELDDKINNKTVKCERRTCRWKGALRQLESHTHTSYPDLISTSTPSNFAAKTPELPTLETGTSGSVRPQSQSRLRAGSQPAVRARQPLTTSSQNNNGNNSNPPTSRSTNSTRASNGSQNNASSTSRTRTRSRSRNAGSPQRRVSNSTTGLPNGRLTQRARIRNGGTSNMSSSNSRSQNQAGNSTTVNENTEPQTQTITEEIHAPRPPSASRPVIRRLPTLPGLVNMNNNPNNSRPNDAQTSSSIDTNNNVNTAAPLTDRNSVPESPRAYQAPEIYARRPGQQRSFGTIRERLLASRHRLDTLMSAFSTEIERGRQDVTDFQVEREMRRQQQMADVRDLGRRLSQVASELQGLLSQRRQIQTQIDTLADNVTEHVP